MRTSALLVLCLANFIYGHTGFITTSDKTRIFYRDTGNATGQPIVFSHGWPLSSDNFANQMFFLGQHGYRVIAHDRRGHGYSSQPWTGNDMDTYADDLNSLFEHLNLKNAMMVGHSTGGGEVVRFLSRHGESRVSKAVLVSAVTPIMVQGPGNLLGTPLSTFDDFRAEYTADRANFFLSLASGPFYGYNLPGAVASPGVIEDWMQQGLRCGFVNGYECIKAFSQTNFTNDMLGLTIPVLLIHGDADQVVPIQDSADIGIKLLKKGTLKIYPGAPHGLPQAALPQLNADLLAFVTNGTVS
jgi:non-heme chloroperoxidase